MQSTLAVKEVAQYAQTQNSGRETILKKISQTLLYTWSIELQSTQDNEDGNHFANVIKSNTRAAGDVRTNQTVHVFLYRCTNWSQINKKANSCCRQQALTCDPLRSLEQASAISCKSQFG